MTSNEGPRSESDEAESADSPDGEGETQTVVRDGEADDFPDPHRGAEPEPATDRIDAAAEAFLAVENRLGSGEGTWRAVGVEMVPAETVPADYPRAVSTDEALELIVEPPGGGSEESLYVEFPEDGVVSPGSDLGRLLARLSIPADRFGDLLAEPIPVARSEGALVLDVSDPTHRGSDRAIVGLLGGFAVLVAAAATALAGVGSQLASPLVLVVLALVNFVVLPLSTYLDGWHLRSTTRWRHAPGMWALLAILPGINLVTTALYLLSRRATTTGR